MALIYNYLCAWIPFAYLNFIGTVLMGFGGAFVGGIIVVQTGRVRNIFAAIGIASIIAFLTVYLSWMTYVPTRTEAGYNSMFAGVADLINYLPYWKNSSLISIYPFTIEGGWLAALWIIEALLIGGISFALTIVSLFLSYHCEHCGAWSDTTFKTNWPGAIGDKAKFKARLKQLDFSCIAELGKGDEKGDHSIIEIEQCPDCKKDACLTVKDVKCTVEMKKVRDENASLREQINIKTVEKEERSFNEKDVVKRMWISSEHVDEIKQIIDDIKEVAEPSETNLVEENIIEAEAVS